MNNMTVAAPPPEKNRKKPRSCWVCRRGRRAGAIRHVPWNHRLAAELPAEAGSRLPTSLPNHRDPRSSRASPERSTSANYVTGSQDVPRRQIRQVVVARSPTRSRFPRRLPGGRDQIANPDIFINIGHPEIPATGHQKSRACWHPIPHPDQRSQSVGAVPPSPRASTIPGHPDRPIPDDVTDPQWNTRRA